MKKRDSQHHGKFRNNEANHGPHPVLQKVLVPQDQEYARGNLVQRMVRVIKRKPHTNIFQTSIGCFGLPGRSTARVDSKTHRTL